MSRALLLGVALLATGCVEVDPLLPCRSAADCPANQICTNGECLTGDAAPPGAEAAVPPADAAPRPDAAPPPPPVDAAPPPPDAAPSPCDDACARVADCAVMPEHCPDFDSNAWVSINAGCLANCRPNPGFAALIASKRTCADVIATVSSLDRGFAAACGP